jgi:hypothetical protein
MNIDYKKLKDQLNNQALFSLVNSWLNAKAHADFIRGKVDQIQRRVLEEVPLYQSAGGRLHGDGARITDPRLTFMCEDEDACQRYFDRCEEEEDKANLRAGLKKGYCPALVAEERLVYISHAIADIVCPFLDIDKNELFCQGDGVDTWNKFINLIVKAVVNHPNFEPINMYEEATRGE